MQMQEWRITSHEDLERVLKSIGFYRLRGYLFHLYDNATKKYPDVGFLLQDTGVLLRKYPKCKHYPAKTEPSINDFRYGCRFSMQSTFYTPHKQRLVHFIHPVIVAGNCDRMCIAPLLNRHIFRMSLTILDHACSLTESAIPCNQSGFNIHQHPFFMYLKSLA